MSEPAPKRQRTGVGSSVAVVPTGEADPFFLNLVRIKVERLLPRGRKVYTAHRYESLPDAFKKMVDNNVLALPVLNQSGGYFGVLEVLDLVGYVSDLLSDVGDAKKIDVEKMLAKEHTFAKASVNMVMKYPIGKRNPFHPLMKGSSLFSAWEALAMTGLHRVPVVDEEGKLVDLITQSMLVDFLWQNIEQIGQKADKEVKDLANPSHQSQVLTINEGTKAIIAFRQMVREGVSGMAVVDQHGKLVDNISLRDLRGIRPDISVFWHLWSPLSDYKATVREQFPEKTPKEVIYVLPTDTLYTVVEKMATKHIHRVFVVESVESMKPLRVISQVDILREILL